MEKKKKKPEEKRDKICVKKCTKKRGEILNIKNKFTLMRTKFTQVLCSELICFWSDIIYDFITVDGAGKWVNRKVGNEIKFFSAPPARI